MEIEGGESLQSTEVKVADVLFHGPQFSIVVDLVDWNINESDSTKLGEYFQIAKVNFSDKEHGRWDPTIAMNCRSMNTSVLIRS
jgi:hypothetical protein